MIIFMILFILNKPPFSLYLFKGKIPNVESVLIYISMTFFDEFRQKYFSSTWNFIQVNSVVLHTKGSWNQNCYVSDGHFTNESALFSLHFVGLVTCITMQQSRKNKRNFSVMITRAFLLSWWSVQVDETMFHP